MALTTAAGVGQRTNTATSGRPGRKLPKLKGDEAKENPAEEAGESKAEEAREDRAELAAKKKRRPNVRKAGIIGSAY